MGWLREHEIICKDCGDPFTTTSYNADRCPACRVKAKRAARRRCQQAAHALSAQSTGASLEQQIQETTHHPTS